MRLRILAAIAAAVVLVAAIVFLATDRDAGIQVATRPATTGTVARQVLATGTLEPATMVQVGAQVSGTVSELPVDFNSVVKQGDVVARLDPSVYRSRLEASQALLDQATAEASRIQAAADDARAKLARAEELAARELITQAELDTAKTTFDQAAADLRSRRAAIQSAEAGVKQARVDLDRTVIRSPIDGVVVNRNVEVGQTLASAFQSPILFTIADLRTMHLLTEVDEGEIGGVRRGSKVFFRVESYGSQIFQGTVADVRLQPYAESTGATAGASGSGGATPSATGTTGTPVPTGTTASNATASSGAASRTSGAAANSAASPSGASVSGPAAPGVVTYTAVVDVTNAEGLLTPGATAVVTLGSGIRNDVVRVPNNALSFRPSPEMLERTGQKGLIVDRGAAGEGATVDRGRNVHQVWRFDNNRFVPVDVVTGISDDQWTELAGGSIQPGDQLVTSAAIVRK